MTAKIKEACGIFGAFAPREDVSRVTFFGLFALQHRGQESTGIATTDGQKVHLQKGMGLVSQFFDEETLEKLKGFAAIGHNRYSTTGSSRECNAQPILVGEGPDALALAHNGNIVNSSYLREELEHKGIVFQTTTDSEVIAQLILTSPERTWVEKIKYAMRRLQGAYSLVLLTKDALIGVRDPFGVRPLSLGSLDSGWILASETCALDHMGALFVGEVAPGEIVYIDAKGKQSFKEASPRQALCVFEYIYFARPDSSLNGNLIYPCRMSMGAHLAREFPVEADLVIGVPDSATAAGIGYANESGIPFGEALIKNRYVGRTFIEPQQRLRELGVKLKFNPLQEVLKDKRIVVVDDSIVRGTTTPRVISMLRRAGAREIHMRVCAPPIKHPCFFGVDMASRWELIAANKNISQIREFIGADSLGYLSMEGLIESVGVPREKLCHACFTGEYPIPVQLAMDKLALEHSEPESVAALSCT